MSDAKLTTPSQRAGERRKAALERRKAALEHELAQWRKDRDARRKYA